MRPSKTTRPIPRLLYGHGFASSPDSSKGRAMRALLAKQGRTLELLDLRVPDRNHLRLSAMIDVIRASIGEGETAVAIGSSLGGLAAARATEREPRIVGALLIAPAFRLVPRWRARTGEVAWERWRSSGSMKFPDYSYGTGAELEVDFGFVDDATLIDLDGADDAPGAFPDVRVETVVVQGQRDVVVDPELARMFAQGRSNVKLVELDDDHQMLQSVSVIAEELAALIERVHQPIADRA